MSKTMIDQFDFPLTELIPTGIVVFDLQGNKVIKQYVNEGYYRMLHTSAEARKKFESEHTLNAVFPEDIEAILVEAKAAIKEDRPFCCRYRIIDGLNFYRWIEIRANHEPISEDTERFYTVYYDIDELIQTQEKLRTDELMFNELLQYSNILYFVYYPDKHDSEVIIVPEYLKDFPSEYHNFPDSFIKTVDLIPEDEASFRAMIETIDNKEKEAGCSIRLNIKNGFTWVRVRMVNMFDIEGNTIKAIGNIIDINTYKEAEKLFYDEKQRIHNLKSTLLAVSSFNVTHDYQVDLNSDNSLFYEEPEYHKMYQEAIDADSEIAKQNPKTLKVLLSAAQAIPDNEQRKQFLKDFSHIGMKRNYESGRRNIEFKYRRWTTKGLIWVLTKVVLLPDPDSGDIMAFYYTSDINDTVINNRIVDRIVDLNFDNVSYYDISNKKLYFKSFENGEVKYVGCDYDEAMARQRQFGVDEQDVKRIEQQCSLETVINELEKQNIYTVYYLAKKSQPNNPQEIARRIKVDSFYLDANKDIIIFLMDDVTEIYEQEKESRRQLEQALDNAQKANRAKSEFVSRISHDIRTPISIISSMTDFALSDFDDHDKLYLDLLKIKSADNFLLSLINDVLDISKIDSGKIFLNPEPYPYEEHLNDVRNILDVMCAEKGLKCTYIRQNGQLDGTIVADKIRINQITLNIATNAVKYTPKGGEVTYISRSVTLPDNKIRFDIEIKDTGIGMSEAFQKTMFEPFTQEYDNPQRPQGLSGTGLGLSIVKRMIDLMGGRLIVKSALGKGTSVRCIIDFPDALRDPAYLAHQAQHSVIDNSQLKLSGKVLLVEDNLINTEIAKRIVEGIGLTVVAVENGAKGVEAFEKSAPGEYLAILMDIQMPIMNGYEATKAIRNLERADSKTIPIIAMTADAFTDAARTGMRAGMNEYLVKPLDPKKIKAVLIEAKKLQNEV